MKYKAFLPIEISNEHPMGIMEVEISGNCQAEVAAKIVQEWFNLTGNGNKGSFFSFENSVLQAVEIADRKEDHPRSLYIQSNIKYDHMPQDQRDEWEAYSSSGTSGYSDQTKKGQKRYVCKIRLRGVYPNSWLPVVAFYGKFKDYDPGYRPNKWTEVANEIDEKTMRPVTSDRVG